MDSIFDFVTTFEKIQPNYNITETQWPNSPVRTQTSPKSPSSSGKKKRYRFGPRDSLNNRYKIGKPGSRRYRYWENEFFLLKNLSETESELEGSDDWDETLEPVFGAFAAVFEEENQALWEPFVEVTEEQQRLLLVGLFGGEEEEEEEEELEEAFFHSITASKSFQLLRKRSQRTLRRHKDSVFLHQLDSTIFAYANSILQDSDALNFDFFRKSENDQDLVDEPLIFSFSDKFRRHVLHSLCEFYDLVSYSTNSSEERITVVYRRPEGMRTDMSLVQFLKNSPNTCKF